MKNFNKSIKLKLLGYMFIILFVTIGSCANPPHGPGVNTGDVDRNIRVQNPQASVPVTIGTNNPDYNNFVDIQLKISVKTFNSANQAIQWRSPIYKTYSCNPNTPNDYFDNTIKVPNAGMFVIEVTTQALECSSFNVNSSTCSPNVTRSTKQYYSEIHTFQDFNTNLYQFNNLLKDFEECCN